MNSVTTRFVKTATNKMRCPIFCMAWTPEGRRLVTGASSGEFTLWNGLTFNFETILQAHDSPVRTMVWSHNESWMVTGDHAGYVKYWQSNMNNVKMFQAHKEAIRGLSFSPTDHKLATCSDDGTVRIWDFLRCHEERILRGHGADVKCVHWHPQKSLVISGSKDNQQPVKLWDPKNGQSLATLHAHKSTVMDVKWNENGNWLVTASRDHLLKLFDLRNLSQEMQTFRGHKKEASSVAWHPSHEGLFCSGGSDGAILFWHVGADKEVGAIEQAHDSIVWTLAWHPLGHILCSGSNDHTSKFWTRNRPGDLMRDKYNLNTLPAGTGGTDDHEVADASAVIPGMGLEDQISADREVEEKNGEIPGLDLEHSVDENKKLANKKVPYSKPIPRNFQAQWNEMEAEGLEQVEALNAIVNQLIETTPGAVPLHDVTPNAIILYGKMIPVESGSKLAEAISKGTDAINKLVQAGEIEELRDVIGINEDQLDIEDYLQDEGEIDYFKVPKIDLPAPLASSKFAQNPELLKALNRGGKRKFDQLIGWSDAGATDKVSQIYQPVFHGVFAEDSQSNDNEFRFTLQERMYLKENLHENNDEDYRDDSSRDSKHFYNSESYRSENTTGPGRPSIHVEHDLKRNFVENVTLQNKSSISFVKAFGEKDVDDRLKWDKENSKIKSDDNFLHYTFDNHQQMEGNMYSCNNISHTSNINPNMPPPCLSIIQNESQHSIQLDCNAEADNTLPDITSQQSNLTIFRSSGPPSGFGPGTFRPLHNSSFSANPFRTMGPFHHQSSFNNFSGPPSNFRSINSQFDRHQFGGQNYKVKTSSQQSSGGLDNYNSSFCDYSTKNRSKRSGIINRTINDCSRTNFHTRGRGIDNDFSRGTRGRDYQ
ncbi:uncharacterized protein LOC100114982 isoform X2 [Nasonia vitripennis]|nr:uncharacterized protein LOC100114982 isoform X2 [Nasonia vitripennis]XP_031789346.1 uncharacterized protein LOC100114982 isoform X2 [Nasonia vitripennis]XP_031789352.1 uncharacterized protein LOC100114982 isoform X2 [Nasonia vitripennis]XP_031789353.1 uncharacterized protein LOC100114982 isoform X2 [Nasonia vitripennis]XP_031789354.1 uncharacterized protein LOC100114982 isoform X2 [Nasonia vitripennis]